MDQLIGDHPKGSNFGQARSGTAEHYSEEAYMAQSLLTLRQRYNAVLTLRNRVFAFIQGGAPPRMPNNELHGGMLVNKAESMCTEPRV